MYFYSFMDIFLYLYRYVVENSDILVEKKDAVQGRAFKCDYTHCLYPLGVVTLWHPLHRVTNSGCRNFRISTVTSQLPGLEKLFPQFDQAY